MKLSDLHQRAGAPTAGGRRFISDIVVVITVMEGDGEVPGTPRGLPLPAVLPPPASCCPSALGWEKAGDPRDVGKGVKSALRGRAPGRPTLVEKGLVSGDLYPTP